ncbi:MAG TPA: hypothetical protein VHX17_00425 [Candidatus Cybelea sp.]|jgi:DNA-binding beta-propeller fold protein YncE|nr:hypothetical protein [Candidatus Cybelea sp.]
MRRFSFYVLVAALGSALLSACGGSNGSLPSSGGATGGVVPAALQPAAAAKGRIYSSSYGANTVDYYLKGSGPNNPVAGSLQGDFNNPEGLAIDKRGNIYVPNGNGQNIFVYAKGSSSPTLTLQDPKYFPADVAVSPDDGTVYVANSGGFIGASGDVLIYPQGASNPAQTLSNGYFLHVEGVALDAKGNVYVSCNAGMGGGTGNVVEFPKGLSIGLNRHIRLGFAGGVGFDRQGHLLVMDESKPSLNVYAAGKNKPLHKFALPGASRYFAFNRDSSLLYVADYDLGEIDVYRYSPNSLTQTNTITNGIVASNYNLGIAVDPPQQR